MKITCLSKEAKAEELENGVKWFAWYPVRISSYEIAWLEFVMRFGRRTYYSVDGYTFGHWRYWHKPIVGLAALSGKGNE